MERKWQMKVHKAYVLILKCFSCISDNWKRKLCLPYILLLPMHDKYHQCQTRDCKAIEKGGGRGWVTSEASKIGVGGFLLERFLWPRHLKRWKTPFCEVFSTSNSKLLCVRKIPPHDHLGPNTSMEKEELYRNDRNGKNCKQLRK